MTIQRIKELQGYLTPMISTNGINETVRVGSLKIFKAAYKEIIGKDPLDLNCLTCVKRYVRECQVKLIELQESLEKMEVTTNGKNKTKQSKRS